MPEFLPDLSDVRGDLLEYYKEIEWFDHHLDLILKQLEQSGELDNTIVVVTSDNGMAFPRAKCNLYDAGRRVPLAIQWSAGYPGGRVVGDLVQFADLAPTILEAATATIPADVSGKGLSAILKSDQEVREQLLAKLKAELVRLEDPRALNQRVHWHEFPYYSRAKELWIESEALPRDEYLEARGLSSPTPPSE